MSGPPSHQAQVDFLLQVQQLLDEALFTASYKPALLIALADEAVQRGHDGRSLEVSTRQLAEHFVRLYWRQVVPYSGAEAEAEDEDEAAGAGAAAGVLWQNAGKQARVVREVAAAGEEYGQSLAALRRDSRRYKVLLTGVAQTIRTQPLWKLQTVGGTRLSFLYDNHDRGDRITLKPTAVYCLRRFHALIVQLARSAWVRFVRGLYRNAPVLGGGRDLSEFLFGSDRRSLDKYREVLMEDQVGLCFYCGKAVGSRSSAVDHFVPWARYSADLGHGLVLSDDTCNSNKSDRLAAYPHLEAWVQRNAERGAELAAAFDDAGVLHDLETTRRIAEWAYSQAVSTESHAWLKGSRNGGVLEPIDARYAALLRSA